MTSVYRETLVLTFNDELASNLNGKKLRYISTRHRTANSGTVKL